MEKDAASCYNACKCLEKLDYAVLMPEPVIADTVPFELQVSYELFDVGPKGPKPMFIYLHGYKQNINYFKKKGSAFLERDGYHLFIQGPYPIYDEKQRRKVEQWGRAWYLYDGKQGQFLKSLEKSSVLIQQIIDQLMVSINPERTIMIAYSMGGYQAGYFALSRPKYVDKMVIIGSRIKTEYFRGNFYPGLQVLIIHGRNDASIDINRAKESADQLKEMGADVTFKSIDETHRLTDRQVNEAISWLNGEAC